MFGSPKLFLPYRVPNFFTLLTFIHVDTSILHSIWYSDIIVLFSCVQKPIIFLSNMTVGEVRVSHILAFRLLMRSEMKHFKLQVTWILSIDSIFNVVMDAILIRCFILQ
jgi:hypothetical protein